MTSNLDLIRATYEGSPQDNSRHLLATLAPDVRWTEAAGFPYAGTYVGEAQIMAGVFQRLGREWEDFAAQGHSYRADGDKVAAFGTYSGTYRKTGRRMTAGFSHLYELKDGLIIRMDQVVDSHLVQQAMKD